MTNTPDQMPEVIYAAQYEDVDKKEKHFICSNKIVDDRIQNTKYIRSDLVKLTQETSDDFVKPKTFLEGITFLHNKAKGSEKEFLALMDGHLRALYFSNGQDHYTQRIPELQTISGIVMNIENKINKIIEDVNYDPCPDAFDNGYRSCAIEIQKLIPNKNDKDKS